MMPRIALTFAVTAVVLLAGSTPGRAMPEGSAPDLVDRIERIEKAARSGRLDELERARAELLGCVARETSSLRLSTAEALAGHLEAMKPAGRAAFSPLKDSLKSTLSEAAGSARGGRLFANRAASLTRRFESALGSVQAAVSPVPAPAPAARPPAPAPPTPVVRYSPPPAPVVVPPPPPPPPLPRAVAPVPGPQPYPMEFRSTLPLPRPAVQGVVPIVVADFTERGLPSSGGQAAADLLSRSLAASGRFQVSRVGRIPPATDAFVVDGEIYGLRAWAQPRFVSSSHFGYRGFRGYGGYGGYGSYGGWHYPGGWNDPWGAACGIDVTVTLDGRIRVLEGWSGRVIGDQRIGSTTWTSVFGGWWPGFGVHDLMADGTAARVLESAILDRKSGAVRYVLDLLPVTGRVARLDASDPNVLLGDFGTTQGLQPGDRFLVVSASLGREVAILRTEGTDGSGLARLRITGPEHNRGPILVGDSLVSRGY